METPEEPIIFRQLPQGQIPQPLEVVEVFTANRWCHTPVYKREDLQPGDIIPGTAIIVEKISTIVVEPHWQVKLTERNHLILEKVEI
jgi:5-oxoprolinase (ATP-hydrolysing)